jgi:MoaA/NifB/PqqE/SkfB family radical SAM enzyme
MNNLCVLPWIHLATTPTGKLRVCCNAQSSSNYRFDQIEEYKENYLKSIKNEMLENKKPTVCKRCFNEESFGLKSARLAYNEKFSVHLKKIKNNEKTEIVYLDLRLGNSCNLRCRMCNGYSSSAWQEDHQKMWNEQTKLYNWDKNQEFFVQLKNNLQFIEAIYFTGGEPLLNPHHIDILQWLIDNNKTNIELKYNTNLTVLPDKVLKLWEKFSNLKLHLSVDGIENVYEYIRYPAKWNQFLKNYETIKQLKAEIKIHCTVQITNIEFLKELDNWCDREIYWNILEHPDYLNLKHISFDKKQYLIDYYSENQFDKIKKYLLNIKEGNWNNFLENNNKLDQLRKQDFFKLTKLFKS